MKVKVQHYLTLEFHAVGTVEFLPPYIKKVTDAVRSIGRDFNASSMDIEHTGKLIRITAQNVSLNLAVDFKAAVVKQVVLLAEHGQDADLLSTLLDRYPELRNHPDLPSLVSSFENMTSVVQRIRGDKRGTTLAEIDKREREGIDIVLEDLKSTGRRPEGMTVAERAEFRDKAIIGQSPEHIEAKLRSPRANEADLPGVYKKVAAAQKKVDPDARAEASGDAGNVFTTPAKS